jgi:hypothetical protein
MLYPSVCAELGVQPLTGWRGEAPMPHTPGRQLSLFSTATDFVVSPTGGVSGGPAASFSIAQASAQPGLSPPAASDVQSASAGLPTRLSRSISEVIATPPVTSKNPFAADVASPRAQSGPATTNSSDAQVSDTASLASTAIASVASVAVKATMPSTADTLPKSPLLVLGASESGSAVEAVRTTSVEEMFQRVLPATQLAVAQHILLWLGGGHPRSRVIAQAVLAEPIWVHLIQHLLNDFLRVSVHSEAWLRRPEDPGTVTDARYTWVDCKRIVAGLYIDALRELRSPLRHRNPGSTRSLLVSQPSPPRANPLGIGCTEGGGQASMASPIVAPGSSSMTPPQSVSSNSSLPSSTRPTRSQSISVTPALQAHASMGASTAASALDLATASSPVTPTSFPSLTSADFRSPVPAPAKNLILRSEKDLAYAVPLLLRSFPSVLALDVGPVFRDAYAAVCEQCITIFEALLANHLRLFPDRTELVSTLLLVTCHAFTPRGQAPIVVTVSNYTGSLPSAAQSTGPAASMSGSQTSISTSSSNATLSSTGPGGVVASHSHMAVQSTAAAPVQDLSATVAGLQGGAGVTPSASLAPSLEPTAALKGSVGPAMGLPAPLLRHLCRLVLIGFVRLTAANALTPALWINITTTLAAYATHPDLVSEWAALTKACTRLVSLVFLPRPVEPDDPSLRARHVSMSVAMRPRGLGASLVRRGAEEGSSAAPAAANIERNGMSGGGPTQDTSLSSSGGASSGGGALGPGSGSQPHPQGSPLVSGSPKPNRVRGMGRAALEVPGRDKLRDLDVAYDDLERLPFASAEAVVACWKQVVGMLGNVSCLPAGPALVTILQTLQEVYVKTREHAAEPFMPHFTPWLFEIAGSEGSSDSKKIAFQMLSTIMLASTAPPPMELCERFLSLLLRALRDYTNKDLLFVALKCCAGLYTRSLPGAPLLMLDVIAGVRAVLGHGYRRPKTSKVELFEEGLYVKEVPRRAAVTLLCSLACIVSQTSALTLPTIAELDELCLGRPILFAAEPEFPRLTVISRTQPVPMSPSRTRPDGEERTASPIFGMRAPLSKASSLAMSLPLPTSPANSRVELLTRPCGASACSSVCAFL